MTPVRAASGKHHLGNYPREAHRNACTESRIFCASLTEIICQLILGKLTNIRFNEHHFIGYRIYTYGWTDRHGEVIGRILATFLFEGGWKRHVTKCFSCATQL
jgi:hypothetical protein